jgi:hypothetical protein
MGSRSRAAGFHGSDDQGRIGRTSDAVTHLSAASGRLRVKIWELDFHMALSDNGLGRLDKLIAEVRARIARQRGIVEKCGNSNSTHYEEVRQPEYHVWVQASSKVISYIFCSGELLAQDCSLSSWAEHKCTQGFRGRSEP